MRTCNTCGKTKPLDGFGREWNYKKVNRVKTDIKIYHHRHKCKKCRLKERLPGSRAKYYQDNKDSNRIRSYQPEYRREYRTLHREKYQKAFQKRYREHGERIRERYRQLYRDTPKMRSDSCVRSTNRRIAKLKRTPVWCDLKKIWEIYLKCPKNRVIDHIIPLQGKLVSGLHVPENLQYLTPFQNGSKANKFDPMEFVA